MSLQTQDTLSTKTYETNPTNDIRDDDMGMSETSRKGNTWNGDSDTSQMVDHTYREAKEGTAQEDLDCWDASIESVPSSQTTINVGAIRSGPVTMMAHMVGHTEDVVVRDTGHNVVVDTHKATKGSGIGLRLGLLFFYQIIVIYVKRWSSRDLIITEP